MSYPGFGKIPRWNREVVLTEKLDGTNGLVCVIPPVDIETAKVYEVDDGKTWPPRNVEFFQGRSRPPRGKMLPDGTEVAAGSRKRWLNPQADNHGFAQWVWDHSDELSELGPGMHYGEWYGHKINRGYGLKECRFALFNVAKWGEERPKCCEVVTVLSRCDASQLNDVLGFWLKVLEVEGSSHVPGFMRPEGIVLYHTAGEHLYKVTLEGDQAKTADGHVVRPAGAQVDIGLSPAAQAREALENYHNKEWTPNPIGTVHFDTSVAEPDDNMTLAA